MDQKEELEFEMSFFQYLVFRPQVVDNILLMAVDPTRDDEEEQVPGLQDGFHVSPNAV